MMKKQEGTISKEEIKQVFKSTIFTWITILLLKSLILKVKQQQQKQQQQHRQQHQ
jgi:hypothetical protein